MKKNVHKVFALKYRPANFSQLIGQSILVETITNSIKLNKLPNAYLLSGIRGVGKTTTARLIAKAINCKKDFFKEENCDCSHCEEITNSTHLDVLEINGSDKTGIDDVRELIESSRYKPTSAKYKVIILDEIQQISKAAFNALLKILEEPPPHLLFVFATTELKKIPVTIISRCQRFDLHRVPIKILVDNLKKISEIEHLKISENGLKLIAKASEGSVRDSLSLLNRAFVSQHIAGKEIDETFIRKMLGVVDRSKIFKLLKLIFDGNQKKSIEQLRELINEGIEPINFLNDLLEIIYFIQQKKNLGDIDSDLSLSESDKEMVGVASKEVDTSTLILFWQFILSGLQELNIVTNQLLSLEMLVIRLLHLKEMPSYDDLVNKNIFDQNEPLLATNKSINKIPKEEGKINKISKDQIKSTIQTKPELSSLSSQAIGAENIKSFEDLIKLSSKKKEIELKCDLERNVNLIKFSEGKIDIAFNENLSKDFLRNLSEKLLEWTNKRWVITLAKGKGQKTFLETQSIREKELIENGKKSNLYKKFKNVFPDGELIDIFRKD